MSRPKRTLFSQQEEAHLQAAQPLAARMRPRTLDEFAGQQHFLGEGKLLRRLIQADRVGSVIFYGPPGTGKTTLARLLASETKRNFQTLNAAESGLAELRAALTEARDRVRRGESRTLLFVDEIHRFNRTQQEVLLPDLEEGVVAFVGATTLNPFIALTSAVVSRSQVFQFEPLSQEEIAAVLQRAVSDPVRGLGRTPVSLSPEAAAFLAEQCEGDARRALSALEVAALSSPARPLVISRELAAESVQKKAVPYDAAGDQHYDCASALIKSIRGSDVDAGLYWLARMLEGGEDVRFICRRLVILASEDVGNADPGALSLAVACSQACDMLGLPECQLTLSQTVAYLALAPKSNASTIAIGEARKDVRERRVLAVPRALRDSHYQGADSLGNGTEYQYAHDHPDGVAPQDYLGAAREYYRPVPRGFERELIRRAEFYRKRLRGEIDPPTEGTATPEKKPPESEG